MSGTEDACQPSDTGSCGNIKDFGIAFGYVIAFIVGWCIFSLSFLFLFL